MHFPIPIPIAIRHVAAVQGAVWKFVSCEHCQQRYAYLLELQATGEDHDVLFMDGEGSAERARAKAEQNLRQKSRNVVLAVPCPHCGYYQDDMSRLPKEDVSINALQVAGLVIALLSLVPLAFGIRYLWVLTLVLAATGAALLALGYVRAFRFDPNAGDPEPRKALGQRHAVWGERLDHIDNTSDRFAVIDGRPVRRLDAYRFESPIFAWKPLPEDNVFGAPAGTTSPAADAGYYLFLAPLSVGRHVIEFGGTFGGELGGAINTRYIVTVVPRKRR